MRLDLGARAQLLVTPVRGMPGEDGAYTFADLLVGALRQRDVPAFRLAPGGSIHVLSGQVKETAGPDSTFDLTFVWELANPTGESRKTFETVHRVDGLSWLERDPRTLAQLSKSVSQDIETALLPQSSIAALKGVYLPDLEGLPGDGNASLKSALLRLLKEKDVTIVSTRDRAAVEIRFLGGTQTLPNGADLVVLVWELYYVGGENDGERIGVIDLANPVRPGIIQGKWRGLARAAARGSAQGIIELLAQAGIV